MADSAVEQRLTTVEVRLAKLESTVEARERDFPSRFDRLEARLDRLDQKVDRIPGFILASWLTTMLALIGGLYFKLAEEYLADTGRLNGHVSPRGSVRPFLDFLRADIVLAGVCHDRCWPLPGIWSSDRLLAYRSPIAWRDLEVR